MHDELTAVAQHTAAPGRGRLAGVARDLARPVLVVGSGLPVADLEVVFRDEDLTCVAVLDDGRIVGYEALLRWRHPQRGLLMPDSFLSVAEESGLSEQIDWLVFERVCQVAPALTAGGCFVGINLSGRHFHSADLGGRLLDLFEAHGVLPGNIRVEVTEHVLLDNPALVKRTLQKLRGAGVTIALDDFGTGYSSLSYLHQFPLQALKIDRSFVSELTTSTGSGAVVRAILALAGSLGMQVIAEGIETDEQRSALLKLGCELGQGFLLGQPQPVNRWIVATV